MVPYKDTCVLCNLAMHNSSNFPNVLVHLKLLQWRAQPFKGQSHPFETSRPVSCCCLHCNLLEFLSDLSGAWLMERKAQELGIMARITSFSKYKPCWVKSLPFTQLTSDFPEVGTHNTLWHCFQQFAHVSLASMSKVLPTPYSPSEEKIAKCCVSLACLVGQVFFFFLLVPFPSLKSMSWKPLCPIAEASSNVLPDMEKNSPLCTFSLWILM